MFFLFLSFSMYLLGFPFTLMLASSIIRAFGLLVFCPLKTQQQPHPQQLRQESLGEASSCFRAAANFLPKGQFAWVAAQVSWKCCHVNHILRFEEVKN